MTDPDDDPLIEQLLTRGALRATDRALASVAIFAARQCYMLNTLIRILEDRGVISDTQLRARVERITPEQVEDLAIKLMAIVIREPDDAPPQPPHGEARR